MSRDVVPPRELRPLSVIVGLLALACSACAAPVVSDPAPSAMTLRTPEPSLFSAAAASPSAGPTCSANFAVSGGWEGEVVGEVPGAPRRIGVTGEGISVDVWFEMAQDGKLTQFLFSVFDVDGPAGSKPVEALFGETSPLPQAHGWYPDLDPGAASLAGDGSRADFDLELGRIGVGPGGHVTGSVECPPLS